MTITGGGKRASGGGGRTKQMDKDEKLEMLRTDVNTKVAMLSTGNQNPSITSVMTKVELLMKTMVVNTDDTMPTILSELTVQNISSLLDSCGNGNSEFKLNRLTKVLFIKEFGALNELRSKVATCEQLMRSAVDVSFLSTYLSEGGGIRWSLYVKDLSDATVALSKKDKDQDTRMG